MPHYTEYRLELDPILRIYCESHTSAPRKELNDIERKTNLTQVKRMDASDMLQGRLLSMFSHLLRPDLIVEIGTFTAYATGCLVEGLRPDGKIISIENKELHRKTILDNLEQLGISDRVDMRFGDAQPILKEITGPIDLVFIDAAKHEYSDFFDIVIDKVRTGGLILADNTLWKGRVLEEEKDRMATSVDEFNKRMCDDPRVEVLVLPYRDGLSIIRKK